MKVCEKHVGDGERYVVAHHLTLRSFAAIEQQRFALAHERERGDVPLDGGPRSGSAEKAKAERHGLGI
jgi:hypothetical protein